MIDFTELPLDGVKFEQLVRELLLVEGMRPFWTGQGSDGGRDLLVEEKLQGTLQDGKRLWLVDCKHKAHSGKPVNLSDVSDITDRCKSVGAEGILIACSTHVSSGLSRRLQEICNKNNFLSEIWDGVALERKLISPNAYHVAQQFFPVCMGEPSWKIYFVDGQKCWMTAYKGNFLYLFSRSGMSPLPLCDAEVIVDHVKEIELGDGEELRVRSIWHDTPNGPFYNVCIDYLVPSANLPLCSPKYLKTFLNEYCVLGGSVNWCVRLQVVLPQSDYYSEDDRYFYANIINSNGFDVPEFIDLSVIGSNEKWIYVSPPPIRRFDEAFVWSKDKEKFGFTTLGNVAVKRSEL